MKKKILLIFIATLAIITSISLIRWYSHNEFKRYLKSQKYQYLSVLGGGTDKKQVRATIIINMDAFEHEEEFIKEVQKCKCDIEQYIENKYTEFLPSIPNVEIAILNDDFGPYTIHLANNSESLTGKDEYFSNELKIDCGYFNCPEMNISSLNCLDGFKYLRINEFNGTDYANALQKLNDLQYLQIETKENINEIDSNMIKEQHPDCKIEIKQK
ncbi:MAG TPA: hypothetical protein HA255_04850 [Methanosphaera sp.]|nr:hypothetical protein [Methanosphaera sp.]